MNNKEKKDLTFEEEDDEQFSDRLDLLKYVSEVQSRIKKDISSDFTLAKLDEKTKQAVLELTSDAYFCKRLILLSLPKTKKKYQWDHNTKEWYKTGINQNEQQAIKRIADLTFDCFMNTLYMCVILNRNVPNNHLVRLIVGKEQEEPTNTDTEEQPKSLAKKIKDVITGKNKQKIEDND